MAGKTATISMLIGGDASGLRKATKNATRSLQKFSKSTANATKKVTASVAKMTAGISVAAVGLGAKAVDLASDFDESMSKTQAIFLEASDSIIASAGKAAEAVGLSKAEFLDAASGFGVFGKAADLSGDDLSAFADSLVTTAADVASFNNLTTGEAIEKLSAGLRGSNEPLQSIGILINAAQVEAKALEMGLGDLNGEVSEGNKILARQALIMDALGSQGALGDFAKTSEGLANQQRILQARLKNVGITIGTALLPVAMRLAEAVASLIAFMEQLAPRLQVVLDRAKELGQQWLPKLREAFTKVREAVEPVIKRIVDFIKTNPKPFLLGLATVLGAVLVGAIGAAVVALGGIIFSVGGFIAAIGAAVTAIAYFWQESETFRYVVTRVFQEVKNVTEPIINGIKESIENLQEVFEGIITFLKGVFSGDFQMALDGIKGIFSGFYNQVVTVLETIKEAITRFFDIEEVKDAIETGLDAIYGFIKAIPDRIGKLAKGAFDALLNEVKSMMTGIINEMINGVNFLIEQINRIPLINLPTIPTLSAPRNTTPFGPQKPDIPIALPMQSSNAVLPLPGGMSAGRATNATTINVYANDIDGAALISNLRRTNRNTGGIPIDSIGFNGQAL